MLIEIREQPFDPWQELSIYQQREELVPGSYGACTTFVGTMRDLNLGDQVKRMHLEHYEGMTERQLTEIAKAAISKFNLIDLLIVHRVGEINPNDSIVLVATWSAHRAAAFDGCREVMEYLKSEATFWKKETLDSSQRWVEQTS